MPRLVCELDLIDGVQVGRVRNREEQALAAPEQRQHAMLGEELVADQAYGIEVEVDRVQIEQRHAELVGGRERDIAGVGGPAGHQLRDDAGLALAGGVHRIQHGRLFDNAVLDQPLRQAAEARARGAER